MPFCDCCSRREGAFRRCHRCAGQPPLPPAAPQGWVCGNTPLRVVASGKTCPECGEITYLSRMVCTGCGHAYRTIFQTGLAAAPGADAVPDPSSSGAGRVFLLACVFMVALAAGLIFCFVNFC